WTSTDPAVATAGSGGFVTGVATGSTTIRATFAATTGLAGVAVGGRRSLQARGPEAAMTVTSGPITLDGSVHGVKDNGLSGSTTATVSIGTPTAGDLITCEVSLGGQATFVSVTDNNNGIYAAAVPVHLNTTLSQWFGIYYMQNVAGSATTVTLTAKQSTEYLAIGCQAWKGTATSNSLDSSFVQLQDAVN